MVINKNSENKRTSYLKYVREIIKSLEENQETWRMIVCGNSNKKTFYADDFFNIIINLEEKVINIFRTSKIKLASPLKRFTSKNIKRNNLITNWIKVSVAYRYYFTRMSIKIRFLVKSSIFFRIT